MAINSDRLTPLAIGDADTENRLLGYAVQQRAQQQRQARRAVCRFPVDGAVGDVEHDRTGSQAHCHHDGTGEPKTSLGQLK